MSREELLERYPFLKPTVVDVSRVVRLDLSVECLNQTLNADQIGDKHRIAEEAFFVGADGAEITKVNPGTTIGQAFIRLNEEQQAQVAYVVWHQRATLHTAHMNMGAETVCRHNLELYRAPLGASFKSFILAKKKYLTE